MGGRMAWQSLSTRLSAWVPDFFEIREGFVEAHRNKQLAGAWLSPRARLHRCGARAAGQVHG